jgi:fibronectin type 3 domain-containing protein
VAAVLTALLLPMSGASLPQAAPVNTSLPTISGTAASGQTLAASTGSWSGTAPITFTYQWRRCDSAGANCSSIDGATSTTYVLQSADVGSRLRVVVTASNADGLASAPSEPTAVVTAGDGPQYSGEPQISGSLAVGQTLSTTNGTWSGSQPMTFAYQWMRCGADGGSSDAGNCAAIAGATRTTYVLASTEVGFRIRVRVTASNSSGSQTATSNPTGTVAGSAPVNSRIPTVAGSWVEGQTVTVNRGTWTGAAPITYSYQWLRCNTGGGACVAIGGATGTQYRLVSADVGRKIRVNVTARNSGGSRTVMSGESATVAAAGPTGVITLPTGERSIPATSVPSSERLVVDRVVFTPTVVRSRSEIISVQVRVKDTRGYVVRDALVFLRSTPLVTRAGQPRRTTQSNGYAVFQMTPRSNFPTTRRGALQFFVKAYRQGDNALAGVAGYRLVQVRIAR